MLFEGVCVSGFFFLPRRFGVGDSTVEARSKVLLRWKEGGLCGVEEWGKGRRRRW